MAANLVGFVFPVQSEGPGLKGLVAPRGFQRARAGLSGRNRTQAYLRRAGGICALEPARGRHTEALSLLISVFVEGRRAPRAGSSILRGVAHQAFWLKLSETALSEAPCRSPARRVPGRLRHLRGHPFLRKAPGYPLRVPEPTALRDQCHPKLDGIEQKAYQYQEEPEEP
jgi:hypothetical protein